MTGRTALAEAQRLMSGFRAYQLVVTACHLELPDILAAGPKTSRRVVPTGSEFCAVEAVVAQA